MKKVNKNLTTKGVIVIKRDGSEVTFDKAKIKSAVVQAMTHGSGLISQTIARLIATDAEKEFKDSDKVTIFNIEKYVYERLIHYGQTETAKSYEGYRAVQEFKRNSNTTDASIFGLLKTTDEDILRENSNKNSFLASTQRDLMAGELSKDLSRRRILPAWIVQAHDEGLFHWHDMDYTAQNITNCCLINLEDMLDNGTVINDKLVETPKSFATACTVTTQIIAQIASNQYGGNTIRLAHLAKYLRVTYDKFYKKYFKMFGRRFYKKYFNKYNGVFEQEALKSFLTELAEDQAKKMAKEMQKSECKAGIQTIRYQLSTLQTTNGQAPFCSISLEVIKGDEYEKEQAMLVEEMIKQRMEGMKNKYGQEIGEAFPKLLYHLDENNCLDANHKGKYDYLTKLAARCTIKRLVPDYISNKVMKETHDGEVFDCMGCRSWLSPWKDAEGNYKWWGRGNIGVLSLNLVQPGIIAAGDFETFWEIFDQRLNLCKDALLFRRELLRGTPSDVSPIHWQHGGLARLEPGETIDKLIDNGYMTISLGYVGLYELVKVMTGESHTTVEGHKFAVKVMQYMRDKVDAWKKETGLSFGLYGSPAESLVYKFCRLDRNRYGEIAGVTDKQYYTNSYHVNVTEEIDAFSKLDFESEFQNISSGGCISYIEVPDMSKNPEAIETVINHIYNNIQYAEINTKPDVCYKCGFRGEIKLNDDNVWTCPSCGNQSEGEMQIMRRTCGYIGTNLWNKGKTEEIKERVVHL